MSIKHWWEDIDRGMRKYLEKNLSQWHFVHHKSHMDWSGVEAWPQRWLTWTMARLWRLILQGCW